MNFEPAAQARVSPGQSRFPIFWKIMKLAFLKKAVGFLLAFLVIAYFYYYFSTPSHFGYEPLPFSPEAWANADPERRGYMVNDLLQKYKDFEGLSWNEVHTLLGGKLPEDKPPIILKYNIGYYGGNPKEWFAFIHFLFVEFDKDGKVKRVYTGD
jgi:hypothetical protein